MHKQTTVHLLCTYFDNFKDIGHFFQVLFDIEKTHYQLSRDESNLYFQSLDETQIISSLLKILVIVPFKESRRRAKNS